MNSPLLVFSAGPHILAKLKELTDFYPLLYTFAIAALSYIAAVTSYQCYEKHFLRLKERFRPRTPGLWHAT